MEKKLTLNIHEIVGNSLSVLTPWQSLIFTKTLISYKIGQDTPVKTKSRLVLRGKIQPANPQEIKTMGFNLSSYEYYKVFITGTPSSLSEIDSFASDTFEVEKKSFKIISTIAWDRQSWREAIAVRIKDI